MKKFMLIATFFVMAVSLGRFAGAQTENYPSKPVRLIVPFPPGGGTDLIARGIAQKLSENLGQQMVVDNRGGASGNLGTELAAKAAPDGYTLLLLSGTQTVNATLFKKLPYDLVRDFTAISQIAAAPLLLVSHPSLPVKFDEVLKVRGFRFGLHKILAEADWEFMQRFEEWVRYVYLSDRVLDRRVKELVIVGILCALRSPPQHIKVHINKAVEAGATKDEVIVVSELAGHWGGTVAQANALEAWRLQFAPELPSNFQPWAQP